MQSTLYLAIAKRGKQQEERRGEGTSRARVWRRCYQP